MGVFFGTISDDCIDTSSLLRHLQGPRSAALHWQCTVVLRRVKRAFTCFLLVLDLCSKNWCRKRMLLCSGLCTHVLSVYDGSHLRATVSCTKQKAAMNSLKTVSLFRRPIVGANCGALEPLCCAYLWETYWKRLELSEHLFPFMHQFHSLLSSRSNVEQ